MLQKFDPRNNDIKVWIKDRLYPREQAKVSVFDSVVQGGDAVWEGLRVYPEGIVWTTT
jgi:branched-chain amino acid aminotransferase